MVLLKKVYLHSIRIINFYTFASPSVGNIHFAEEVKRVTKGFYRIVNLSDVVPTLPITAMPNMNNTSDQLSNFGDSIQFLCKEDSVHLISGSIEGKMDINILSDKIETYEVDEGCDMNTQFQLRYLQTMANFQKINKYIDIMMSEENFHEYGCIDT